MVKRVNKATRLILDVTEAVRSQGVEVAADAVLELELTLLHHKVVPIASSAIKAVRFDLRTKEQGVSVNG